jgi:hypothetical protein
MCPGVSDRTASLQSIEEVANAPGLLSHRGTRGDDELRKDALLVRREVRRRCRQRPAARRGRFGSWRTPMAARRRGGGPLHSRGIGSPWAALRSAPKALSPAAQRSGCITVAPPWWVLPSRRPTGSSTAPSLAGPAAAGRRGAPLDLADSGQQAHSRYCHFGLSVVRLIELQAVYIGTFPPGRTCRSRSATLNGRERTAAA